MKPAVAARGASVTLGEDSPKFTGLFGVRGPTLLGHDVETPGQYHEATETSSKRFSPSSREAGRWSSPNLAHGLTFSDEHFYTVSGELKKNLAFVQMYKSLPELEVELFDICKQYETLFALRGVDLSSLKLMYPITQLQDHKGGLAANEVMGLTEEIDRMLELSPWALLDFRWIERVVCFINLLIMKWELVDPNHFRYRNSGSVPIESLQLHKYKMRQIWVFPIETIWLACAVTELPLKRLLPSPVVSLGRVVQLRTLELIRTVASLNFKVNFKLNPSIREFLSMKSEDEIIYHTKKKKIKPEMKQQTLSIMGERVSPSGDFKEVFKSVGQPALERGLRHRTVKPTISKEEAKVRYRRAREIGFHLLELPTVLCRCMQRDFHAVNDRLRRHLVEYERVFRVFECHMMRLIEENPSAFGTCEQPPQQSHKQSEHVQSEEQRVPPSRVEQAD